MDVIMMQFGRVLLSRVMKFIIAINIKNFERNHIELIGSILKR